MINNYEQLQYMIDNYEQLQYMIINNYNILRI